MNTTNTPKPVDREWLRRMADAEEQCGSVSVGGLAADLGEFRSAALGTNAESVSSALALARLVKLWRREQGLTVEDFAKRAGLSEFEVVGVESGEMVPEPRVLFQLSQAIKISYDKLMYIAGHMIDREGQLMHAAYRFAARSESMEKLTRQEEEALHEFINTLAQ